MKNIWDVLAWLVLIGIAIWLVLKTFGIINLPLWLEYAPVYGAVYLSGWAMSRLDRATDDVKEIKQNVKILEENVRVIREKCLVLMKHQRTK